MKYFRAFFPQWRHKVNKKRIFYETSIEVKPPAQQEKKTKEEDIIMDDDNEDDDETKKPVQTGPVAEKFQENELIITSDNGCLILGLIIKGLKGEQHKVIMFNPEKFGPLSSTNRAGNCELEFNMNSHIREYNQVFIVQTEPNDTVTAKQLKFNPDEDEDGTLPTITFSKPMRGYAKDCWLVS